MNWTLTKDSKKVNHNPVAILNGHKGKDFVKIKGKRGDEIVLDSTGIIYSSTVYILFI